MVVLVTGGSRGIGLGIATAFSAAGHEVITCARRPPPDALLPCLAVDVRDPDAVAALVDQVVETHGRLDVLVNNAGGSPAADTATASPRFTEAIVRLNLIAPLVLAQRANAVMQAQETGGVIINICSVAGMRPAPTTAAYGAAKAGLLSLTRTLALEWAPRVRVNAVTPGLIATERAGAHYPDLAAVAATVPLGRLGTPQDVAAACVWLASAEASYVSGANLVIDGGGERPAFLGAMEKQS